MNLTDITTVAAVLGGSLGTLVIKSIVDYFNKIGDHKRDLSKLTYLRKLDAAESAVAFYSHYRYNVIQIKTAFDTVLAAAHELNKDHEYDEANFESIQKHLDHLSIQLKEMFGEKYQKIQAVNLYFEFHYKKGFSASSLADFYKALSETEAINSNIDFWNNYAEAAENGGNLPLSELYRKNALNQLPAYIIALQKLIDILNSDSIGAEETINAIKNQIKLY